MVGMGCSFWPRSARERQGTARDGQPPVIGAWFWSQDDLEPEGYKTFFDEAAKYSPFSLLSTACRRMEVVEPRMHDQAGEAVRYANSLGLKVALEVDLRLAL